MKKAASLFFCFSQNVSNQLKSLFLYNYDKKRGFSFFFKANKRREERGIMKIETQIDTCIKLGMKKSCIISMHVKINCKIKRLVEL